MRYLPLIALALFCAVEVFTWATTTGATVSERIWTVIDRYGWGARIPLLGGLLLLASHLLLRRPS